MQHNDLILADREEPFANSIGCAIPRSLDGSASGTDFAVRRIGVIMSPQRGASHEAWGVLNPAGVRSPDGTMHLFPRLVDRDNVSRIGHARVLYDGDYPSGAERLGLALASHASDDASSSDGILEDPRVVYVPLLRRYVMTYTAFVPTGPRVAVAISKDLRIWKQLGFLRYEVVPGEPDINLCSNKDAAFFSDVILDPLGVPSFGILHRPTVQLRDDDCRTNVSEHIWISYISVDAVLSDVDQLTSVKRHERIMAPQQPWEAEKIGAGPPPVRLPYGWVLPYHAVATENGRRRYCMGLAILDPEKPSQVLYRTPSPILQPLAEYERGKGTSDVIFPSATDLRTGGELDIFYGAADRVIAVARVRLPNQLP
jgi:beta-1,2-mannobiose phosphorylase / 1,2-beta-oligomannan phosphorylase